MASVRFATKTKNTGTHLEELFEQQLIEAGYGGMFEKNAPFLTGRRFKGDFVFPELQVVAECDGGEWLGSRGGHTSGAGFTKDRERDQLAYLAGWVTFRFTGGQVKDGSAIETFKKLYAKRRERRTD